MSRFNVCFELFCGNEAENYRAVKVGEGLNEAEDDG